MKKLSKKYATQIVRRELRALASGLMRGRFKHTTCPYDLDKPSNKPGFNMKFWLETGYACGTVGCIGGWLDERLSRKGYGRHIDAVGAAIDKIGDSDLFTPQGYTSLAHLYTPYRCGKAVLNYLATGKPKWAEVMKGTDAAYWNEEA